MGCLYAFLFFVVVYLLGYGVARWRYRKVGDAKEARLMALRWPLMVLFWIADRIAND